MSVPTEKKKQQHKKTKTLQDCFNFQKQLKYLAFVTCTGTFCKHSFAVFFYIIIHVFKVFISKISSHDFMKQKINYLLIWEIP